MKKVLLAAALMLSSVATFAQHAVGTFTLQPKVGMTLGNVTDVDGDMRVGVMAGVEGEYQATDMLGIAFGVNYAQQGEKLDYSVNLGKLGSFKIKNTLKLDYINVPIVANVYVVPGLAVKAGVQFGFNVNSEINNSNLDKSVDLADGIKTFDFSIPVGLSYEYSNFVLDARYNFGCTKIVKDDYNQYINSDAKNSVFQITLGYKFAL